MADQRAARRLRRHYAETLGTTPEPIIALEQALPEFASGFLAARQAVVRTPGALPTWVRELLLAILSADAGFAPGGRNHLRAALDAGLSRAQLDEALGCLVLVRGLSAWDRVGSPLWDAADELDQPPTGSA